MFLIYSTTLSVTYIAPNEWMIVNNELESMWKEVVSYFKVLSLELPAGTEKTTEKLRIVTVPAEICAWHFLNTNQKGSCLSHCANITSYKFGNQIVAPYSPITCCPNLMDQSWRVCIYSTIENLGLFMPLSVSVKLTQCDQSADIWIWMWFKLCQFFPLL
jgi:hypothetical protein